VAVGVLRITRKRSQWKDRLRAYEVLVDGNEVGRLGNGECRDFELEPGHHTVRLKIDWTGSPERSFSVSAGETVGLHVRATAVVALWRVLSRERYLSLEFLDVASDR
jgi:hypothetical protein